MARLLSVIMERNRNNRGISALEIEHLVLTTVRAALDMATNAVINDGGTVNPVRELIEVDRIVDEIKEDFTAMVQQYWPAGIFNERDAAAEREAERNRAEAIEAKEAALFAEHETVFGTSPNYEGEKLSFAPDQGPATQAQLHMVLALLEKQKALGMVPAREMHHFEKGERLACCLTCGKDIDDPAHYRAD